MTTHHTEDRLQHYEFDQYTVTTNFANYEDAVNYANEHQGELVEVGFTDGSDNPTPNDLAKLVESKKPFKVELPDHPIIECFILMLKDFKKWQTKFFLI